MLNRHGNPLFEFLPIAQITVVLTENEVLLFKPNGSLRFNHGLPDIPEEIAIVGTKLVIKLRKIFIPIVANFHLRSI